MHRIHIEVYPGSSKDREKITFLKRKCCWDIARKHIIVFYLGFCMSNLIQKCVTKKGIVNTGCSVSDLLPWLILS